MTPIIRPKDALLAVSFLEAAVASRGPLTDARRSTIQYGEYARNQRNSAGRTVNIRSRLSLATSIRQSRQSGSSEMNNAASSMNRSA